MSEGSLPVIEVEGLGKEYALGSSQAPYGLLRDRLREALTAPLRWIGAAGRRGEKVPSSEGKFWALRDVSFRVSPGEVVGIIGRNGAGKSSVLKILSRITEPTEGRAIIRGRVGSLLEVGTGFHPELNGRENIFLNGAILGMTRRDIERQFDAIVSFAEVERFIDTPVKFYSSGMYLRLAFAVAAHLNPEILIIDEVLAVGDAAFQKKCLHKMEDVSKQGRTVLFVSHSLSAIAQMCPRCILLEQGRVAFDGDTHEALGRYLGLGSGISAERTWDEVDNRSGDERVRLHAVRVVDEQGQVVEVADIRRPVGLQIEYTVLSEGHILASNHELTNEQGVLVFITAEIYTSWGKEPRQPGRYRSTAWIPGNLLAEGTIIVTSGVTKLNPMEACCYEVDCVSFLVKDGGGPGSAREGFTHPYPGTVRPILHWRTEPVRESLDG